MNTAFRIDKEGNLSICGDLKFFQGDYTNAPTEDELKTNLRTYLNLESGNYLPLSGGTIAGDLEVSGRFTIGGKALDLLYAPLTHTHPNYLPIAGGTITEDLNVDGKIKCSSFFLQNTELRNTTQKVILDLPSSTGQLALTSFSETITIPAADWTGDEAPFSATFSLSRTFDGENHTVFFAPNTANTTIDNYNAIIAAKLSPSFASGSSGTIYANGEKPEIDINFILV